MENVQKYFSRGIDLVVVFDFTSFGKQTASF